jgi:hypothetical protein
MGFIRPVVAVLFLCLLCCFFKHASLQLWRLLVGILTAPPPSRLFAKQPDGVTPVPILDTNSMPSYFGTLGRGRFRRMIFSSQCANERVGYFRLVGEDPEARRLGKKRSGNSSEPPREDREPRLALGWKGLPSDSSPWEVPGDARDASGGQVKAAYRKLITKFHPERFQNLSDAEIGRVE